MIFTNICFAVFALASIACRHNWYYVYTFLSLFVSYAIAYVYKLPFGILNFKTNMRFRLLLLHAAAATDAVVVATVILLKCRCSLDV